MEIKNSWSRCVVAVCLALLFSFSSLAALVSPSSQSTTCCRVKDKCCCHKHHHGDGPEFASRSCGTNCAQVTLGGIAAAVDSLSSQTSTPVLAITGAVNASNYLVASRKLSHSLQQRPPPSNSIS